MSLLQATNFFNNTCLGTALQSVLNAAICGIWHCEPRKHLAKAIV